MLFNSYAFIFLFFPICYLISTWLSGQRLIAWIALASVVFYALAGHLWFLVPMFITTSLDFYLAKKMESADSSQKRKRYLVISLIGNLGLLFFFKYVGFFATNVQLLSSFLGLEFKIPVIFTEVILPAGISFYTFQTLSYMIDVYKRECRPEVNFLKFLAFVSFFPHLVAGPLTRHHQLLPQLDKI